MSEVVTRFAPSPSGYLHIGSLRTAAYAYALAKHFGGKFILRIEDTDQKREVEGAKEKLMEILNLFNLKWDEFYIQSERVREGIYAPIAQRLVDEGKAFYCQCEAKNAKAQGFSKELRDPCRDKQLTNGAIKLKVPNNYKVSYRDYVGGKEISWDTNSLADPTLLKSDGFPTYHLAVVVDDYAMKVTHVLRGHDWQPSTPIHLLVYEFLGYEKPEFGHLTDILDPAGGKLSKRKGTTAVENFLSEGYLPEALFNFVILLGWAPKDNRELFSLEDFVVNFDPDGFQTSNPVLNMAKLNWFNGHYIRQVDQVKFASKVREFVNQKASDKEIEFLGPLIQERVEILGQIRGLTDFIWEEIMVTKESGWKNEAVAHLVGVAKIIQETEDWSVSSLNDQFMKLISENNWKTGHFFMNLRIAISGQGITPPITECIYLIGKDKSALRISKALEVLS